MSLESATDVLTMAARGETSPSEVISTAISQPSNGQESQESAHEEGGLQGEATAANDDENAAPTTAQRETDTPLPAAAPAVKENASAEKQPQPDGRGHPPGDNSKEEAEADRTKQNRVTWGDVVQAVDNSYIIPDAHNPK